MEACPDFGRSLSGWEGRCHAGTTPPGSLPRPPVTSDTAVARTPLNESQTPSCWASQLEFHCCLQVSGRLYSQFCAGHTQSLHHMYMHNTSQLYTMLVLWFYIISSLGVSGSLSGNSAIGVLPYVCPTIDIIYINLYKIHFK